MALADQIGSDEEQFHFVPEPDPNYIEQAHRLAKSAIEARLLRRRDWRRQSPAVTFADLFDHPAPRPLQTAVADAPLSWPLLVLESETGSGKTEAAALRFSTLWRAGLVDGLYFAVPTRAAAKQLQRRLDASLRRLFAPETRAETVLAIPGYLKAGTVTARRVGKFEVEWEDEPRDESTRRARWSAESSRRFLNSAAAVGTVDQVLLAALKVKWAHLRGSALSRSLLVVDEAHASDAYMMELVGALLRDHLAVGGHALLMSATLGSAARAALTDHRPRTERTELPPLAIMEAIPYPALTLAGHGAAETLGLSDSGHSKAVEMCTEPCISDADRIAELALASGRKGGKVLVVRNTVREAQAVFHAVENQGGSALTLQAADGPALHHSRFAAEDRLLLDSAVERALGKGRADGGVVVIGTQTLEQSLDIDADVLISDICPVDVLLQRIGRLHRHREAQRAAAFTTPRCTVLMPEEGLVAGLAGELLRYGLGAASDGGGIYRDLLGLEAAHRLVAEHPMWEVPAMNRMLVEQATHEEALRALAAELGGPWVEHEQQTVGFAAAERGMARRHLLDRNTPFDEALVFPDLDEKVRTRLGDDGPRIELARPEPGPFGEAVRTFNLPAHFFLRHGGGLPTKEEIEAVYVDRTSKGLVLKVAGRVFEYDRCGVHEADEPAA
ncbi:MAG: CRISPR-associated helicase Cas3' [Spirochaetaceae bacterium]|nr:CRISPR-associated helicase Cas3' [Spirochaetaceae bacterium]